MLQCATKNILIHCLFFFYFRGKQVQSNFFDTDTKSRAVYLYHGGKVYITQVEIESQILFSLGQNFGEQEWRSGESARLPPMWPGFDFAPGHMWVEFVVGSCLALRVFLQVLRFSSLYKNQHSKF